MICPHYRAGTSSDLICRVCLKGCHGGLVLSMEVLSTCIWVVAGAITVGGALSACSTAEPMLTNTHILQSNHQNLNTNVS